MKPPTSTRATDTLIGAEEQNENQKKVGHQVMTEYSRDGIERERVITRLGMKVV